MPTTVITTPTTRTLEGPDWSITSAPGRKRPRFETINPWLIIAAAFVLGATVPSALALVIFVLATAAVFHAVRLASTAFASCPPYESAAVSKALGTGAAPYPLSAAAQAVVKTVKRSVTAAASLATIALSTTVIATGGTPVEMALVGTLALVVIGAGAAHSANDASSPLPAATSSLRRSVLDSYLWQACFRPLDLYEAELKRQNGETLTSEERQTVAKAFHAGKDEFLVLTTIPLAAGVAVAVSMTALPGTMLLVAMALAAFAWLADETVCRIRWAAGLEYGHRIGQVAVAVSMTIALLATGTVWASMAVVPLGWLAGRIVRAWTAPRELLD